ncbi:16S rRNA (guanine(527)-N(7))-methyltransferase RsmG [Bacteroidales bacterium]|nr:16S rRNA (guanine(527)-N(7))-methyltransferase RsmG [Bacteroidales bacterium]
MDLIKQYFPSLSQNQNNQFDQLSEIYAYWNERINVISRKDVENIEINHVLHSLAIAKYVSFRDGAKILDVGTGGGFPGIPLAIMFPKVQFHMVDSIAKKIKVVNEVAQALGLTNVLAEQKRAEKIKNKYDFVVSRAVTQLPRFVSWIRNNVSEKQSHSVSNGILYLKGEGFEKELEDTRFNYSVSQLSEFFTEDFFETKLLVHLVL